MLSSSYHRHNKRVEIFFSIENDGINFFRLVRTKKDVDCVLHYLTPENIESNYVLLFNKINNNTGGMILKRYFREQFYKLFSDLLLPQHRNSVKRLLEEDICYELVKNQFRKKKKKRKDSNKYNSFKKLMDNLDVNVIRRSGVSTIYKSNRITGKPTYNLPRS